MADETLSQHCSLMGEPGKPPKTSRPKDCPKDAAYVNFKPDTPADVVINGTLPIPVVFQGGDGDDTFKVVGDDGNVIVFGGKGDDTMELQSEWAWAVGQLSGSIVTLGAGILALAAMFLFVWLRMQHFRSDLLDDSQPPR